MRVAFCHDERPFTSIYKQLHLLIEHLFRLESHRAEVPQPPFSDHFHAYTASKVMTLNATREWMDSHQPVFDVINIQPTVVIGRDDTVTDAKDITRGSNNFITGPLLLGSILGNGSRAWEGASVHLDDVALMHVRSLNPDIAGNQDFLATSQPPDGVEWAQVFDIVERAYPNECADGIFEIHTKSRPETRRLHISSAKAERAFDMKFKTFEEQVVSVVDHYLELLGRK